MDKEQKQNFMDYEYKKIDIMGEWTSSLLDWYLSLGWQVDSRDSVGGESIMLRRSRKIINKVELTRLQRNMEACADEIVALRKSKTTKANTVCLIIAFIGTAFMAGAVFAITAAPPVIWLCIVLSVPGFALWITAPLLHPQLTAEREKLIHELVEQKYDEIAEICEKAGRLL